MWWHIKKHTSLITLLAYKIDLFWERNLTVVVVVWKWTWLYCQNNPCSTFEAKEFHLFHFLWEKWWSLVMVIIKLSIIALFVRTKKKSIVIDILVLNEVIRSSLRLKDDWCDAKTFQSSHESGSVQLITYRITKSYRILGHLWEWDRLSNDVRWSKINWLR